MGSLFSAAAFAVAFLLARMLGVGPKSRLKTENPAAGDGKDQPADDGNGQNSPSGTNNPEEELIEA